MASVELKGLRKEYDGAVAVEGLDLNVKDKEFVVLLGPSGCGKTTTLRCIAGLEDVDGGEIHIGDRLVNDMSPRDRNIAMVFQSYALYPHMTVYQNMAFPLENAKVPEREIVERVNRTARLLQIEGLLSRKPAQLSGGQRQRVALGRAIVREPTVFLMDEPLINLVPCDLQDGGALDAGEFQIPVPNQFVGPLKRTSCERVLLGIRPQDLMVSAGDSPGTEGEVLQRFPSSSVPAEIYTTEPLGDATILDLKVGAMLLKALVGATFEGDAGTQVVIRFPPERIHLFDRTSGRAIE